MENDFESEYDNSRPGYGETISRSRYDLKARLNRDWIIDRLFDCATAFTIKYGVDDQTSTQPEWPDII